MIRLVNDSHILHHAPWPVRHWALLLLLSLECINAGKERIIICVQDPFFFNSAELIHRVRDSLELPILLTFRIRRNYSFTGSLHCAFSRIDSKTTRLAICRLLVKQLRHKRAGRFARGSLRLICWGNGIAVEASTSSKFRSVSFSLRSRVVLGNKGSFLGEHASMVGRTLLINDSRRNWTVSSHHMLALTLTWRLHEIRFECLTLIKSYLHLKEAYRSDWCLLGRTSLFEKGWRT
jgi:hypothetical protein